MDAPFECLVADDGSVARIDGTLLDAAQVEALIWRLADCRAAMMPRRTGVLFEGSRIHVGEALTVTTGSDGQEITVVMHPGLGWVGARR